MTPWIVPFALAAAAFNLLGFLVLLFVRWNEKREREARRQRLELGVQVRRGARDIAVTVLPAWRVYVRGADCLERVCVVVDDGTPLVEDLVLRALDQLDDNDAVRGGVVYLGRRPRRPPSLDLEDTNPNLDALDEDTKEARAPPNDTG